jgi:cytochrome c-type biogenesis protein CcmE
MTPSARSRRETGDPGTASPATGEPAVAGLDLSPRPAPIGRPRRRWGYLAVTVVLLGAALGVLWKGLSDATLFFYNADEAVEQRLTLGDSRFRLQGTVLPDSVLETPPVVAFTVTYNGALVDVEHTGAPPELFQEGMPVVLDGRWDGDVYASDNILVKHDEVYVEDHGDRLDDAEYDERDAEYDERDAGDDERDVEGDAADGGAGGAIP